MLEPFFRTHEYLVERVSAPVRRQLIDEINWNDRLIGILGFRGVGKTALLLQYARENFSLRERKCLYINMNNFFFQNNDLVEFAAEFLKNGGHTLLIDQVYKQTGWSHMLREIYERFPKLHVVFAGSSVMPLDKSNPELDGLVKCYTLKGFSLREYLNLKVGLDLKSYNIREIQNRHERIAQEIMEQVNPLEHIRGYLHHGYYPFFLEQGNFTERLHRMMNLMIEVDILHLNQIELKYLDRLKKLFYILATGDTGAPNVSQLAVDVSTSRATVMNYIKFLTDAGLLNLIYRKGEDFPKKPARTLLSNTNLMYAVCGGKPDTQFLIETFFQNALWGLHDVKAGDRSCTFLVDDDQRFRIVAEEPRRRASEVIYVRSDIETGRDQEIPLWLYGFLY
ncbi:MAG: ATP-binding protein [Bacteroidaceae bacterium]|nr:ATP-binding protein [Bacteroidaceae bacterium]